MKLAKPSPDRSRSARNWPPKWPGRDRASARIAAALAYVWYAKTYPPHVIYFGPIEILVAVGFALDRLVDVRQQVTIP